MRTQSPDVIRTTCLVGVSGGRPMVFHCLCEMRVTSEAESICNRTEWPFSFTNSYFRFDQVLERKVATKLYVCVFFFSLCICYVVAWVLFCALAGCRTPFYVLAFGTRHSNVSWMDPFERNASHHNSRKQMEVFYVLRIVTLSSVDFERRWLWVLLSVPIAVLYENHAQDSPTADTPLQLVVE